MVVDGREELGCDGVCLHLLDAARDSILLQVVSSGYIAGRTTEHMSLTECPAVRTSIFDGEVIAVDDALSDPRVARRAIDRFKIRACVYAPIKFDGRGEGIVIASYRTARAWTPEQVDRVAALGRRCAAFLGTRDHDATKYSG